MTSIRQLDDHYKYHPPTPIKLPAFETLRDTAKIFATLICATVPPSRERALALTSMQETVMKANLGVALLDEIEVLTCHAGAALGHLELLVAVRDENRRTADCLLGLVMAGSGLAVAEAVAREHAAENPSAELRTFEVTVMMAEGLRTKQIAFGVSRVEDVIDVIRHSVIAKGATPATGVEGLYRRLLESYVVHAARGVAP